MAEMGAAMAQVSAAEINAAVQSIQGMPTPQIDDMTSEMSTAVANMWYMANPSQWGHAPPTVDPAWAGMANEINASLSAAVGSGLTFTLPEGGGFSASFGGNFESLSPIDQSNGIFDINIDGTDLIAHWDGGSAFAPPDPNDPTIYVTGTRPLPMLFMPSGFTVSYAENGYDPFNWFGGMARSGGGGGYGSTSGATYDSSNGLWHLPAHMTADQKEAVAYNEAKGVHAAHRESVMEAILHVIENNDGRSFEAAAPFATVSNDAEQAAWSDASLAFSRAETGTDPTNGSTNWIMRPTDSTATWMGLTDQYQIGPFTSSTSEHYVNFFRDPAYAK